MCGACVHVFCAFLMLLGDVNVYTGKDKAGCIFSARSHVTRMEEAEYGEINNSEQLSICLSHRDGVGDLFLIIFPLRSSLPVFKFRFPIVSSSSPLYNLFPVFCDQFATPKKV